MVSLSSWTKSSNVRYQHSTAFEIADISGVGECTLDDESPGKALCKTKKHCSQI